VPKKLRPTALGGRPLYIKGVGTTAYGKKWEKEILPQIAENAARATKRVVKRFGEKGERFDPEMRRMAENVIEWLLSTDQSSIPLKVLRVEVNAALDFLEAWKRRTDALEEALRECSRIGHEFCCLLPVEVADKIDFEVGRLFGKGRNMARTRKEAPQYKPNTGLRGDT